MEDEVATVSVYAVAAMVLLVYSLAKCLWGSPKPIPNDTAYWAVLGYGCLFTLWVMNMPAQSLFLGILGFVGTALILAIGILKEPHKGEIGHDPDDPSNRY